MFLRFGVAVNGIKVIRCCLKLVRMSEYCGIEAAEAAGPSADRSEIN